MGWGWSGVVGARRRRRRRRRRRSGCLWLRRRGRFESVWGGWMGVGGVRFVREGLGLVRDGWTLVGWSWAMMVCP